jgi:hypothetical protein
MPLDKDIVLLFTLEHLKETGFRGGTVVATVLCQQLESVSPLRSFSAVTTGSYFVKRDHVTARFVLPLLICYCSSLASSRRDPFTETISRQRINEAHLSLGTVYDF